MQPDDFDRFFDGLAGRHLIRAVRDALLEDGPDLTTNAVFSPGDVLRAEITARQRTLAVGMPLVPLILEETSLQEPGAWHIVRQAAEGAWLEPGETAACFEGSARVLLRAERVILNFLTHLCGIANLTRAYADALADTGVRLLDTRKTLPGLRYPEKYAVLAGGGCNHRKNLGELLMLKDNHIDAAGGIAPAVMRLRAEYDTHIPVEVECRTAAEVREAAAAKADRIMLDNMVPKVLPGPEGPAFDPEGLARLNAALALVPESIEAELSGNVTLESIGLLARSCGPRKPDFISVGRLTHSAPAADFSMRISPRG